MKKYFHIALLIFYIILVSNLSIYAQDSNIADETSGDVVKEKLVEKTIISSTSDEVDESNEVDDVDENPISDNNTDEEKNNDEQVKVVKDTEPEKNVQTGDVPGTAKDEKEVAIKKKPVIVKPKVIKKRKNFLLLDIDNSEINEKRIPGFEEPKAVVPIEANVKIDNKEKLNEIKKIDKEDNIENKTKEKVGILFFNKENNELIPGIIVLTIVLILLLYRVNRKKKKRKRMFRRIPKR